MVIVTERGGDLPAAKLSHERREAILEGLNRSLAALLDLALAAKQAHWNVQGPNFQGLHELFDDVANGVRGYADEFAERAVALGGVARGTLQDAASRTPLPPFPAEERQWQVLTGALLERVVQVADLLREQAAGLDDELATQDLYVETIRALDKYAWMLRAHREGGTA